MPQEPLDLCEIVPNDNGDPSNPNRNSVLYNAMIHPLIRLSIKGALWYQGINENVCIRMYILREYLVKGSGSGSGFESAIKLRNKC